MIKMVQEERQIKSWEEYLSAGMEARESKDNSQWQLGDLSMGISKDYGDDSIGKFAYAIGVEKKTLMNYRTISSAFRPETRQKYKKLSFSHFAVLTPVERPEVWLEKADNEEWNVETLRNEVRKVYSAFKEPKLEDEIPKVFKCTTCGLWRMKDLSTFDICKGHYTWKDGKQFYE